MVIGDAKTPAEIDELKFHAHLRELLCDPHHHFRSPGKGFDIEDLRADMAVDPDRLDIFTGKGFPVCCGDLLVRDAELARCKAGGDLRVGGDLECRVHAERDLHGLSGSLCAASSWWSSSSESSETFTPFSTASFRSAGVLELPLKRSFSGAMPASSAR